MCHFLLLLNSPDAQPQVTLTEATISDADEIICWTITAAPMEVKSWCYIHGSVQPHFSASAPCSFLPCSMRRGDMTAPWGTWDGRQLLCLSSGKKNNSIDLPKSNFMFSLHKVTQPILQELHSFSQCNCRVICWKEGTLTPVVQSWEPVRVEQTSSKFHPLFLSEKDLRRGDTESPSVVPEQHWQAGGAGAAQHHMACWQWGQWWDPVLLWGHAVTCSTSFCHWKPRVSFCTLFLTNRVNQNLLIGFWLGPALWPQ